MERPKVSNCVRVLYVVLALDRRAGELEHGRENIAERPPRAFATVRDRSDSRK